MSAVGESVGPPTVALLTDASHPSLGPDDVPLVEAFTRAGWRPVARQWRAPAPGHQLAVVRSCWDYAACSDEFLIAAAAWADHAPLCNPLETLRWNASKRYLLELSTAGLPLPETRIVEAGDPLTLAAAMADVAATDVVVKPLVGASGMDTWRTDDPGDARWAARKGAVLVQRFMPEILDTGELSLVWFRDGYSHAVRKRARGGEFRVQEDHGGRTEPADVPADILKQAERVLGAVDRAWWYARVDGIVSQGRFVLMELELIEPELFFRHAPGSAARFVRALAHAHP